MQWENAILYPSYGDVAPQIESFATLLWIAHVAKDRHIYVLISRIREREREHHTWPNAIRPNKPWNVTYFCIKLRFAHLPSFALSAIYIAGLSRYSILTEGDNTIIVKLSQQISVLWRRSGDALIVNCVGDVLVSTCPIKMLLLF